MGALDASKAVLWARDLPDNAIEFELARFTALEIDVLREAAKEDSTLAEQAQVGECALVLAILREELRRRSEARLHRFVRLLERRL
ncbi:hypothetical protein SEA_VANLEE_74 [Gordonia phage VanLee]|uniref:Uncharacterized protein n=1 Tax=Gordonia phage VanLee TaxID=2845816 RepID=A0A8F2IF78_9CAUD|nr:hypothetical protein QEH49_gp074 [Gordonia phage VanLee]QWS68191.1 hypothetical protein SEA_VANLEE_74 [Gordonia phage VanLee]